MREHSLDAYVICPYYKVYSPTKIECEGLEMGHAITQNFNDPKLRLRWMKTYCCSFGYRQCMRSRIDEDE